MFREILKLLVTNILVFFAVALVVEVGGQVYAYFNPAYKVFPFVPHPSLGWRFIPNSKHIVTGDSWYAREFSAEVNINSHGFRDFERIFKKDKNTIRIALLGDSMISARQVDFEKTAGQLLEKKLNDKFRPKTGKKYEVLNFGVDGSGVDQMLLNWNHFAAKFDPDFLFLYLFEKNYLRTVSSIWCQTGFFGIDNVQHGDQKCLGIRPSIILRRKPISRLELIEYRAQNALNDKVRSLDFWYVDPNTLDKINELIEFNKHQELLQHIKLLPFREVPPRDYERFIKEQNKYLEKYMNGKRMVKVGNLVLVSLLNKVNYSIEKIFKTKPLEDDWRKNPRYTSGNLSDSLSWKATNLVNLKTLQVLGDKILNSGSEFIIMDSFQFHNESIPPTQFASNQLKSFSKFSGYSYIPLYEELNASLKQGVSPTWVYDMHLNEMGNEIFAKSMFGFLESKL